MDKLQKIKEITNNATPVEKWCFGANVPFYVDVQKPAPSMSKHDDKRPTYWRYEDGLFVGMARHEMPNLISSLELAIETLEKLVESDYDSVLLLALSTLNEIEKRFKNE